MMKVMFNKSRYITHLKRLLKIFNLVWDWYSEEWPEWPCPRGWWRQCPGRTIQTADIIIMETLPDPGIDGTRCGPITALYWNLLTNRSSALQAVCDHREVWLLDTSPLHQQWVWAAGWPLTAGAGVWSGGCRDPSVQTQAGWRQFPTCPSSAQPSPA